MVRVCASSLMATLSACFRAQQVVWEACVVLGIALIMDVAVCGSALGVEQHGSAQNQRLMTFDIPSQPLAAALEGYGNTTGLEVLYKSGLAVGRRSRAVSGPLTPEAALRMLLGGTGLDVRYLADHSLMLIPEQQAEQGEQAPAPLPVAVDHYYARIQANLREALCATGGDARPGSYQVTAQLWIDLAGHVVRYQRLDSTGTPDVDRNIDRILRGLSIDTPPPQNFAQPVTIMVMPQGPGMTMSCDAARSRQIQAGP
jgi:hypothetical protein